MENYSRSTFFCTLPMVLRDSSSTNRMRLGSLNLARSTEARPVARLSYESANRLQNSMQRDLTLIRIRQRAYLNSCIEQSHEFVERVIRMLTEFTVSNTARTILDDIGFVYVLHEQQSKSAAFTR